MKKELQKYNTDESITSHNQSDMANQPNESDMSTQGTNTTLPPPDQGILTSDV